MSKRVVKNADNDSRIEVRLPKDLKHKLEFLASGSGLSTSAFVRKMIEDNKPLNVDLLAKYLIKGDIIQPVIVDLSRVGNNLNQTTRVLHTFSQYCRKMVSTNKALGEVYGASRILATAKVFEDRVKELAQTQDELKQLINILVEWSRSPA